MLPLYLRRDNLHPMGPNCMPKRDGTELIYNSIVAGSLVSAAGGAANYICMAIGDDVEYHDEATTANLNMLLNIECKIDKHWIICLTTLSSVLYVQCPLAPCKG